MSDPLSHALQPGFRLERHGPLAELVLSQPRSVLNDPIHDIAQAAQVSQPTVSRALSALGDEVVPFGAARSIQYTLRDSRRVDLQATVYRVTGRAFPDMGPMARRAHDWMIEERQFAVEDLVADMDSLSETDIRNALAGADKIDEELEEMKRALSGASEAKKEG